MDYKRKTEIIMTIVNISFLSFFKANQEKNISVIKENFMLKIDKLIAADKKIGLSRVEKREVRNFLDGGDVNYFQFEKIYDVFTNLIIVSYAETVRR